MISLNLDGTSPPIIDRKAHGSGNEKGNKGNTGSSIHPPKEKRQKKQSNQPHAVDSKHQAHPKFTA